jgi:hypothetical protein
MWQAVIMADVLEEPIVSAVLLLSTKTNQPPACWLLVAGRCGSPIACRYIFPAGGNRRRTPPAGEGMENTDLDSID